MKEIDLYNGDCLKAMNELIAKGGIVGAIITSPPYWGLRDYSEDDALGCEIDPKEYVFNNL